MNFNHDHNKPEGEARRDVRVKWDATCLPHTPQRCMRSLPHEAPTEGELTPPPVTPLPLLNTLFVRQRVSARARVEPLVSLSRSLSRARPLLSEEKTTPKISRTFD